MIRWVLIAVAALSVVPALAQEEKERRTYVITIKDGRELPVFWNEKAEYESYYRVERDTPWNPGTENIRKADIVSEKRERALEREKRLEEASKAAGFTLLNGRYIQTIEVELAEKAREWATPPADDPEPIEPAPETVVEQTTAPADDSGNVGYWGAIATIVVLAGALIGLVVKTMLMGE